MRGIQGGGQSGRPALLTTSRSAGGLASPLRRQQVSFPSQGSSGHTPLLSPVQISGIGHSNTGFLLRLLKPANLSTVKTYLGAVHWMWEDPPAYISFLAFPHTHFQSCPSRPARHMPHLAQACILVTPSWPQAAGGEGVAHICTGSIDWLVQEALGSRSLGISLPVSLRDGKKVWEPCFEQKQYD